MKNTPNFNLPLYEPNDLANLTDGYNNAMSLIDTDMKAVTDHVDTYDTRITTNADAIAAETTRATAAEKVNADAIAAEVTRATAAEKVNADAIAAETTRATAAEKVNADAIANINAKFPVSSDNIANNAVSMVKLSSDVQDLIIGSAASGTELVVIGDSVSYGTGASSTSNGWATKYATYNGLNLHNYAENNAGFIAAGSGSAKANFLQQAENAVADSTFSNDDVSKVIIMGGCNDSVQNTQIGDAVANTVITCVNGFKNAKIYVIPYFWGAKPVYQQSGYKFHDTMTSFNGGIKWISNVYNVHVIYHAWEWMAGLSVYMSDFIHPNDSGHEYLAETIRGAINSGTDMRPYYHWSSSNLCAECTDGIVTVSGNYTMSSSSTAYGTIVSLPAWCNHGYQNHAVSAYNASWEFVPLYYTFNENALACPNALANGTQLYIPEFTFPLNI